MTTLQEYRESLITKLPKHKGEIDRWDMCHKMALRDLSDAKRDRVVLPKLVGVREFLNIKRRVEYLEGKQSYTNPQHNEPKIEPQIKIISL